MEKWKFKENIPAIQPSEWPQISSHCTEQEFDNLIKLIGNPRVAMANQATGRQTPVKEYCQNLNNSFQDTVNRNKSNHLNNPSSAQAQLIFTPHPCPAQAQLVYTPHP